MGCGASKGMQATREVGQYEDVCSNPRPHGCSHKCQLPSHRGDCPPCKQRIRKPCYCKYTEKRLECYRWNNANTDDRETMLSCGERCQRTLQCGHRCQLKCHPGSCPLSSTCVEEIQATCTCGRKRAKFLCRELQSGDGLQCDLTCEEEAQQKEHARKLEKERQRDAERERALIYQTTQTSRETTGSFLEQFRNDRGKDYFNHFPTPSLLAEAQHVFTNLHLPVPEQSGIKMPYPTPSLKDDVFKLEEFEEVDSNALQTDADACSAELETLVAHLISPTQSDIGRVRAIFRWIANQDVARMTFTGREDHDTAAYFLGRIKADLGGYHELFKEMCRLAKIPCVTITGYVKGTRYEPGKALEDQSGAWSAVYVDETWRFVDVHWGSRHVSGSDTGEYELLDDGSGRKNTSEAKAAEGQTEYQCNEFYFLTDPQRMIYSHCPTNEAWQLLARPTTLGEFRDMALLRPTFFELGLDVDSHPRCGLKAENGTCSISLRLPQSGVRRFVYHLYRAVKSENVTIVGNMSLDRYVFLETIKDESIIRARINFPTTGKFKLQLYSQDTSEDADNYKSICAYSIYCDEVTELPPEPFPPNSSCEWGPGRGMDEIGLTPVTHTSAIVETENGEIELRFRMEKKMDFLHKFFHEDAEETQYQNYVFHRYEDDEVVFRVKAPDKRRYALNLYAKEVGENGTLSNICNYMVEGDCVPDDTMPFPEVSNGRVGPTDTFHELGITADDYVSPGFFEAWDSGELELQFELSQPVSIIPQLHLQTMDGTKDHSKYCTYDTEGDTMTVHAVFPETGMYKLSLFGKSPFHDGNYPSVYRAFVQVNYPKVGGFPFPGKLEWKSNYKIHEPESGYLPTMEKVRFLANIPDAVMVALIDDTWTQLERNDEGLWEGQFETGDTEREVKLSASLAPNSETYSTLLIYQVLSQEKLDEIRQSQQEQCDLAQEKIPTEHNRLREIEEEEEEEDQEDQHQTNEEGDDDDERKTEILEHSQQNHKGEEWSKDESGEEKDEKKPKEEEREKENDDRRKEDDDRRRKRKEKKRKKREERERKRKEEEELRQREKREKEKSKPLDNDDGEEEDEDEYNDSDYLSRKAEEYQRKKKEREEEDRRRRETEENEKRKRREERKQQKERERELREQEDQLRETERKNRDEEATRRRREEDRREAEEELRRLEEEEKEANRQAAELDRRIAESKSQADKEEMEKQRKHSQEQRDSIARERLKVATRNGVRFTLGVAIDNFKKRNLKQKNGELDEAETLLDTLILRDDLHLAMAARDVQGMKDIIAEIENRGYQVKLNYDVSQARNKIYSIEKMSQFNTAILDMDAKLMSEIRRYNNPPEIVHRVFVATLLLLGKHEGQTRNWKKCQKYCNPQGPEGLKSQVLECDVDKIHPEIAARADQIIDGLEVEPVRQSSAGAATFFVWCKGVIEEVQERTEEDEDDTDEDDKKQVEPANKARQKEIFSNPEETRRVRHHRHAKTRRKSKPRESEKHSKPRESERHSKLAKSEKEKSSYAKSERKVKPSRR